MKRRFTILTAALALLAFLALPMGMRGQTRAEVIAYTLDGTQTGGSSGYDTESDITQNDINWKVKGNTTMNPWRIGGKSLSGVDRLVYSTTPIADNITKIEVEHGTASGITVNSWTVIVASDASFTNVVSTLTPTFTASATTTINRPTGADWTGCYYKFIYNVTVTGTSNKFLQFVAADFYKQEGSGPVIATPTFDPAGGSYTTTQNVIISCDTEGSTIYYTTDGSTPDNTSTQYNGAITVSETTTINAIAYVGNDASSVATATYTIVNLVHAGTEADPYSVADAHAAIDAGTGTQGVYATGIVSSIPDAWSTQYNNITFNFVDTAGDTDYLQAYRCVSGTGVDASTVAVGDVVVVFGTLKKHTDGTYEFGSGCQLVSLTHPVITTPTVTVTPNTINAPAEGADGSLVLTYENITDFISFDFNFCDAEGNDLQENPDWIDAEINEENDVYTLDYLIDPNQGAARTAYMKVYTFDDELEEVYAIVTVNQAEYVAPTYAELPFAFDGGKAAIANINGLYQEGLGGDYDNSPKLKFDGAGDYVLLQFEERPGILTFDVKGNGSGSEPWAGEFKVQVSTNGIDYIDKVVYETGDLTSTKTTMTIDDLAADVRYIKWVYVTKTKGNVALGNINLAAYQAPVASITVTPALVEVDAEEHDGTLDLTYENLTITDMTDFDIQFCDANGEELSEEPDWIEVLVAEQDPEIGEGYVVSYYMIENDGDARTAYFKVYAMDAETNLVYSNLVTVTQAAPVAPAYYVCSENGVAGEPVEVTTPGTTVTLAPGQDLNSDFTFAGWTNDENNVDQLITEFTPEAGTSYAFYAVYAHTTGAPTSKEGEGSYVKVTSTADITDGNYLIVFEGGAVAFDGSLETMDVADNTISIFDNYDAENNVIASNNAIDAAIFTITSKEGGYSVKSASGLYIGATAYENSLKTNEEDIYTNIISIDGGNLVMQVAVNTTQAVTMKYNSASNQNRFRYYKSGQEAIQLYKYVAGSTPTPAPTTAYYTRVFIDETVEGDIEIVGPSIVPSGEILDMGSYVLSNGLDAAHLIIEDGAQVITASAFLGTIQKVIEGYGAENTESSDGYYMFASPVDAMDPVDVNGLITNDPYDLYTYDAEGDIDGNEWINQEDQNNDSFILEAFHGYLYASQNGTTLNFAGEMNNEDMYDFILYEGLELAFGTDDMQRYTMVGNSFTYEQLFLIGDIEETEGYFLTLNEDRNGFISRYSYEITLQPLEAALVYAPKSDMYFYIPDVTGGGGGKNDRRGNLNVRINRADGSLLDNTIITFGNGSMMRKLYLNNTSTRVYIPVEDNEYAAVCAQAQGEMPVNFRAERNSSYVISVDAENVDMNYLHLIDNLTGADIDLLANPSYTFEANTHDYASRFRLVFSAEDNGENANANFAFFDGSQWIITNTGEATLQVVDVMGRVLSTETVNGNVSLNLNQTPGVYMLRLINGDNVNVQKVVVR